MVLNYLMYLLMLGMGLYLIYLSKNIKNTKVATKYAKTNYELLYRYMGYTFLVFALISFVVRYTIPNLEVVLPFVMILILYILNKKYRK
ncbi:hypothetical protein ACMGE7_02315 [Macrococcus equi]|uniref:hypothetical protein n=1 Tax=Macrococcus equi TaxID=3395462 RepID=UPI0039BDAD34